MQTVSVYGKSFVARSSKWFPMLCLSIKNAHLGALREQVPDFSLAGTACMWVWEGSGDDARLEAERGIDIKGETKRKRDRECKTVSG